MNQVNLNTTELKQFMNHIVDNNRYLQTQGKIPVAVAVEGEAGIGKTSTIIQIGKELGLQVVKINLSQIEEIGDLTGFPLKEFEVKKQGEDGKVTTKWVPESLMPMYVQNKYVPSGEKRMSHAAPEWIQGKGEGGILILDDYTRADQRFLQACMELIDRQEYISWKLPKDWHIILTTNPDNGDYNVNSIDVAQKTRFITANLKFDIDCWAQWAEDNGIDSRCINFLLMNPDVVKKETNARAITTFFNSISSIPNFEKSESLAMIQFIAEGSVGPEIGTMFTLFINNKLDKLMSPDKVLLQDKWEDVEKELFSVIGRDATYRADIANVMATRIINYTITYSNNNDVTQKIIDRVTNIVTTDAFTFDIKYHMLKAILNGNKTKFAKLMINTEVAKMAVK
jgi:hypothetical protein